MKRIFGVIAMFAWFLPIVINAQNDLGTWNRIDLRGKLNDRWGFFLEGELRSTRFYDDYFFYEIAGGPTFSLAKGFSLAMSAGHYVLYQTGGDFIDPPVQDEFRLWEQMQMDQNLGRLRFDHRLRAEQRWICGDYHNRFRYRFLVQAPVNRKKIEPGAFYCAVSEELFVTDHAPYFDRNRFYAGAGFVFSPAISLQTGWMRQFVYTIGKGSKRDFLQVTVLYKWNSRACSSPPSEGKHRP